MLRTLPSRPKPGRAIALYTTVFSAPRDGENRWPLPGGSAAGTGPHRGARTHQDRLCLALRRGPHGAPSDWTQDGGRARLWSYDGLPGSWSFHRFPAGVAA